MHEQLYEVCRTAAQFYHNALLGEGKLALEYLRHRGFSDDTIRLFQLGYAPNSWDAFLKHAAEKKFPVETLKLAGLIRGREDGSSYDYFRGRAMFPIMSTTGRVVGFGARKLFEEDPLGKYINSPETPVYNKSKVLYGLYHAREAIRENDNAILVEGYADLISLFQAGVKNVVASSGTALTADQILLLGRYTKAITVVYDGDSAGSAAALRGVDLILDHNLDVRIATLPQGEDPDSFVRRGGREAFQEAVGRAVSFIDFIATAAERDGKLATPEGKTETVRLIVRSIGKINDELKRNFFIKEVAEKHGLSEVTLYRELEKETAGMRRGERRERERPVPRARPEGAAVLIDALGGVPPAERDLVHAMLDGGSEVVRYVFGHIRADDFTHPHTRAIAASLIHKVEEGEALDASTLVNDIGDPAQRRFMTAVVFAKYQLSKRWNESETEQASPLRLAEDAVSTLRRRSLDRQFEENLRDMKLASKQGRDVAAYQERNQELIGKRKALFQKGDPPPV